MLYGYARVSSRSQSYDEQIRLLKESGCETIRAEKQSGATANNRVELQTLLSFVREGDTIVATKIDRVARSTLDLLKIVNELRDKKASLRILNPPLDTSQQSPMGALFITLLGAFAEFERAMIRDRIETGREAARREGRSLGGRKPVIPREPILRLLKENVPIAEIARRLHVGKRSVYRILNESQKGQSQ